MSTLAHDTLSHERVVLTPAQAGEGLHGLLARARTLLATWRRRTEEREALARFSGREMQDIGITKTEVMREVSKPFWRA